jgi:hypothetical protein
MLELASRLLASRQSAERRLRMRSGLPAAENDGAQSGSREVSSSRLPLNTPHTDFVLFAAVIGHFYSSGSPRPPCHPA